MGDEDQDIIVLSSDDESKPAKPQITSPKLSLKRKRTEESPENKLHTPKTNGQSVENAFKKFKSDFPALLVAWPEKTVQISPILTEVPSTKVSEEEDNRKKYKKLIEFCKTVMGGTPEIEKAKIIKNMLRQLDSTQPCYVNSEKFSDLLDATWQRLKNKADVFIILSQVRKELKNYKSKNKPSMRLESGDDSNVASSAIHSRDSSVERKQCDPSSILSTSAYDASTSDIQKSFLKENVIDESSQSSISMMSTTTLCRQALGISESSVSNIVKDNESDSNSTVGRLCMSLSTSKNCDNVRTSTVCDDSKFSLSVSKTNNEKQATPIKTSLEVEILNLPIVNEGSPAYIPHPSPSLLSPPDSVSFVSEHFAHVDDLTNVASSSKIDITASATPTSFLNKDNNEQEIDPDFSSLPSVSIQDSSATKKIKSGVLPLDTDLSSDTAEKNNIKSSLYEDPFFSKASTSVTQNKIDDALSILNEASKKDSPVTLADERNAVRIKMLEKRLQKFDKAIKKLQRKELSLDDLDADDSVYILEEKYKRKFMKVYQLLCQLQKQPSRTGRVVEKKFSHQGSRFKQINEAVDKLINKRKVEHKFPNFTEVLKLVRDVSEDIGLSEDRVEIEAKSVFRDIGEELKKRRMRDNDELFGCYLTDDFNPADDPAERDPEMQRKLYESAKRLETSTQEIFAKYVEMQKDVKENSEDDNPDKDDFSNDEVQVEEDNELYLTDVESNKVNGKCKTMEETSKLGMKKEKLNLRSN